MITNIHIENFKSIQSLDLELGRLNIFIGANGSGKSNILEAIAMGSAAMEDKLDDEFLVNRGVRVAEPTRMKSMFSKNNNEIPIQLIWSNNQINWKLELVHKNSELSKWIVDGKLNNDAVSEVKFQERLIEVINKNKFVDKLPDSRYELGFSLLDEALKSGYKIGSDPKSDKIIENIINMMLEREILYNNGREDFINFLIFAPENHFLRRFEEEAAIKPLGIKGEGLFKLFSIIEKEYTDKFDEILQHLELIDWFESVEIPKDLQFTERRIKIKDRYLAEGLQYFDQRSANEGFLYLLFYLTLFVSDLTPHFFAIDNIDNSLNPKLGSELIKVLAQLAKKHNKQALLTTHNPVILDGLDLEDDDQRLFVVYRNADGHTKVRRVPPLKQVNGVAQVRLSEAFIRGYIGGLPDNF